MRGFMEEKGSWNTICMCARSRRRASPRRAVNSRPWNTTEPAVGRTSCSRALPTVVLPQPDSPTRARVRPGYSSRSTPSTARTRAATRRSRPLRTGKCTASPRAASTGPATAGAGPAVAGAGGAAAAAGGAVTPGSNRWQRTLRPGAGETSRGTCARQWSQASSQRSAKRQPVNTWSRRGTPPGMVCRRRPRRRKPGTAANSLRA